MTKSVCESLSSDKFMRNKQRGKGMRKIKNVEALAGRIVNLLKGLTVQEALAALLVADTLIKRNSRVKESRAY
jgi:hypothetical protein